MVCRLFAVLISLFQLWHQKILHYEWVITLKQVRFIFRWWRNKVKGTKWDCGPCLAGTYRTTLLGPDSDSCCCVTSTEYSVLYLKNCFYIVLEYGKDLLVPPVLISCDGLVTFLHKGWGKEDRELSMFTSSGDNMETLSHPVKVLRSVWVMGAEWEDAQFLI